jgi:hypothetical protein
MNLCPPVAILPRQKSTYTPVRKTAATSRFYRNAFDKHRYDFRAGQRLATALEAQGFNVTAAELADRELAFNGPASPEVLKAWRSRFSRMAGLKTFLGSDFADFVEHFIDMLESPQHRALCRVVCCVGRRH